MNKYETEVIEYKLKLNDSFEKELVAFLNTNGGKVLIGINNNGEVCGVENLDYTMKSISDIIVNGILPNPQEYVKVSAKYIEGKMIVEVDIQKGKELYYIRKYGRSARGLLY